MLLICSNSTRHFFPEIDRFLIISSSLTLKELLSLKDTESNVIAVGGGAVIDAAKVICKNPIVCYPTTAAGTCYTSHSVFWEGPEKKSIKVPKPKEVHVREEFLTSIPESVLSSTRYDAISHCLDSLWSINKTPESTSLCLEALDLLREPSSCRELIMGGNLAGRAIDLCPTTILHSLSYPLTGFYGISHGVALGSLLKPVCDFMEFDISPFLLEPPPTLPEIEISFVAKESIKYKKILDIPLKVGYNEVIEILKKV